MAGRHYSRRNSVARKRERLLRAGIASLRAGTRTAGRGRLVVSSGRFCVMSHSGVGWEIEPWTVDPDPLWSGLSYGAVGCSRSAAPSSTSTSTRAAQSAEKSVTLWDRGRADV